MFTVNIDIYPKILVHAGIVSEHWSGPQKLSFKVLVYLLVCLTPLYTHSVVVSSLMKDVFTKQTLGGWSCDLLSDGLLCDQCVALCDQGAWPE